MRLTWPFLRNDSSFERNDLMQNRDPKIRHGRRRHAIHVFLAPSGQDVDARPSLSMTWWNENGSKQRAAVQ
jgi:hypothetical protein